LFVEAILYRYRTGIPWRDLPARFGDWKIVHQRFSRWAKSGVFERIFNLLASDHDNEYMMRCHHRARSSAQRRRATQFNLPSSYAPASRWRQGQALRVLRNPDPAGRGRMIEGAGSG